MASWMIIEKQNLKWVNTIFDILLSINIDDPQYAEITPVKTFPVTFF